MKKILVKLIEFYQKAISPFFSNMGIHCKYEPTCSEYMKQAIKKYGFLNGFYKGVIRFLKCNPFSKGGYDPLE